MKRILSRKTFVWVGNAYRKSPLGKETYSQYCARCAAHNVKPLNPQKWKDIIVDGKISLGAII